MNLVEMALSELVPAPYNPRRALKAGDPEYAKLRRSIEEFGVVDPVIWNSRTKRVVGGHQRLTVLRDLGHTTAPTVVVDLDEPREKALNLALNKIQGAWDLSLLGDLLIDLDTGAFDMSITGFDPREIEDILVDRRADDSGEEQPVPPLPAKATTKAGDVYGLGRHRLVCGDATNPADLALLFGDVRPTAVWTDPPYGVSVVGGTADALTIRNDESEVTEGLLAAAFAALDAHLPAGAPIYVASPSGRLGNLFADRFIAAGWLLHQTLVWVKNALVVGHADYHHKHELILYGWKRGATRPWWGGRDKTTVIDDDVDLTRLTRDELLAAMKEIRAHDGSDVLREDKPHAAPDHPSMKPVQLIRRTLGNSAGRGDVVADIFAGSGSTLIAAEQLGAACYALELDPRYCDVIVQRWENLAGRKAERIPAGETVAA